MIRPVVGAMPVAPVPGVIVGAVPVTLVPVTHVSGRIVGAVAVPHVAGRIVGTVLGRGDARCGTNGNDRETGDENS